MSKKMLQAAAGNAGDDNLYVDDVFSTYLYDGNGTANNIENGINLGDANVGGSGYFDGTGDYLTTPNGDANNLGTNDFTIECWFKSDTGTMNNHACLIASYSSPVSGAWGFKAQSGTSGYIEFASYGPSWNDYVTTTNIASDKAWHHCAVTRETNTLRIFVDGVVAGTFDVTGKSFGGGGHPLTVGFMAQDVTSYINGNISNARVVKGTAVYTSAFTPSTAPLTAISGTALLTLQSPGPFTDKSGNSLAITQAGNVKAQNFGPFTSADAGAGGLVWLKSRSSGANYYDHVFCDTERGSTKYLASSGPLATAGEQTQTVAPRDITSFNSDGFSLGIDNTFLKNVSGQTFASWTFRKAEKFFDIVTYTGTGSVQNISHNLGVAPAFIITKKTSSTSNWATNDPSQANPWSGALLLNSSNAFATASTVWNDTAPTDSVFTVGTSDATNLSGQTYVAYLFASDAGGFGDDGSESIIKCGSFTAAAGTEVDLGFEPQWVLTKSATSAADWYMFDIMRGWGADRGSNDKWLQANLSDAEYNSTNSLGLTPTGFTAFNGGNKTYIYIAIRRPMKTPTAGTEVFAPVVQGFDGFVNTGFVTDLIFGDQFTGGNDWRWIDRLRGETKTLNSNNTSAEGSASYWKFDYNTGVALTYGGTLPNWIWYNLRRAPGFFDVVAYTGANSNGNQSLAVNHNLGVVPEFIICKNRGRAAGWISYHKDLNGGVNPQDYYIYLERTTTAGGPDGIAWGTSGGGGVAPTSTNFTVGGYYDNGYAGDTYISYLFATLAGVSKVGSYTGTGSNVDVDCGFSAGARFILIKRTSGAGDWYVYNSERGIVAGNDPYLLLNSTASEVTNTDYIDPLASGFTVTSSGGNALNDNGSTYIFLAIA